MRFLILLFLFGISSSNPVDYAIEFEAEDIPADAGFGLFSKSCSTILSAEGAEPETEVVKKYKEAIEAIVEKIEDAIANKKKLKKSILEEFVALRKEIVDKKEELGQKAEELLQKIREHVKDLTIKLVISLKEKEEQKRAEPETEVVKKYKEAIEAIVEKIEDAIANKKKLKKSILEEFVALRKEIVDKKEELGQKAEELLQKIREHVKDLTIKLVISLKEKEEQKRSKGETKPERDLREALNTVLEKIMEEIDKGKSVKKELIDKLRELQQKFKDLKIDLGEHAKELLKKIKDRAKDFVKQLRDKLGIKLKTAQDEAQWVEYLKQNSKLRIAVEKLEKWLKGPISDVNMDVAAAADFLECCEED